MEIKKIKISKIKSNSYNPNKMTEEKYKELLEEIKHLGRIPKPLIIDTNYIIIDGEHTYKASKELKLKELPCEIVKADDFEKRRLTYKYNQHGEHDPVLLGTMFKQMIDLKKISQRELSKQINISEGTVRNALLFLKVQNEVRNGYAVNKLTVKQIRQWRNFYDKINPRFANLWLKAGASRNDIVGCIKYYFHINKIKGVERTIEGYEHTKDTSLGDLVIEYMARINKICWPDIKEYQIFDILYCQVIDNSYFIEKVLKGVIGQLWMRTDKKIEMVAGYCILYFDKVWPLSLEHWFTETLKFLLTEKEEFLLTVEELKEVANEAREYSSGKHEGMNLDDFKENFLIRRIKKKYGKYEKKSFYDIQDKIYRSKLDDAPDYIKKANYKSYSGKGDPKAKYELWKMPLNEEVKKIVAEVGLKPGSHNWDIKTLTIERALQDKQILDNFNSITPEKSIEETSEYLKNICSGFKLSEEEKTYFDKEFKSDMLGFMNKCKVGKYLRYALYLISIDENRGARLRREFAKISAMMH